MSLFCGSWLTTSKTSWDWSKPGGILAVTQKRPRVNESNLFDDTLWDLSHLSCLSCHLRNIRPMKRHDSWISISERKTSPISPITNQHIPFNLHTLWHPDPLSLNTFNCNPSGRHIWEFFSLFPCLESCNETLFLYHKTSISIWLVVHWIMDPCPIIAMMVWWRQCLWSPTKM